MYFLVLIHGFCFVSYMYLTLYILNKDHKNPLNVFCSLFIGSFSLWSFGCMFIHNPDTVKEGARFWWNFSSLGWCFFIPSYFTFSLVFTQRIKHKSVKIICGILYVLAAILCYAQWAGYITSNYLRQPYGWAQVWSENIWTWLFVVYFFATIGFANLTIFNFFRSVTDKKKREQAVVFLICTMIPAAIGSILDIFLPLMHNYNTPRLANLVLLMWSAGMVRIIVKYDFFILSPELAAKNIISSISDCFILLNNEGNIVTVNPQMLQLLEYDEKELIDFSIKKIISNKEHIKELFNQIVSGCDFSNRDISFRKKNGEFIDIRFSKSTLKNDVGVVNGIVCTGIDATDKKRSEKALRESEKRFQTIFEASSDGIIILDVQTFKILFSSPAMHKLLGYTEDEFKKLSLEKLHPKERLEYVHSEIKKQISGEKSLAEDIPFLKKNKRIVFTEINGTVNVIDGKECLVGFIRDISDRKAQQELLRHSEEKFRSLTENAPIGIYYTNFKGVFLYGNKRALEIVGYELEEVMGNSFFDLRLLSPAGAAKAAKLLLTRSSRGLPTGPDEFTITQKNGYMRVIEVKTDVVTIEGKRMILGMLQDITAKNLALQHLRDSEERFRHIAENTDDVISLTTFELNPYYVYVSPSCERMLGYKQEELLEKKPFDFIHPEDAKKLFSILKTFVAKKAKRLFAKEGLNLSETIEFRFRHKLGHWIYCQSTVNVLEGGKILFIARDVTKQKKAAQALEKAKEHAEQASLAKSQFLANISHEIRTPLNAIIGFTETMLNENIDREISRKLQTVLAESDTLLRLINDLLDNAKMEAGKLDLEERPFNFRRLMVSIENASLMLAKKKNLPISVQIDEKIPPFVVGDDFRLKQVIMNIVSNAIKFTEKGSVAIKVISLGETKPHQARVKFEVIDTGIGIPIDRQDTIFQSFTQVDGSTTRKYGGTGLGTTISKHLVESMGGTINLESKEGEGSTFWFEIVFDTHVSRSDIEKLKQTDYTVAFETKTKERISAKILVVEDYLVNQQTVKMLLESLGISVTIANNGKEGFEKCQREKFDLILMDLQMPEMDGMQATKEIKACACENSKTTIIALTANANQEVVDQCKDVGMEDILTKPIRRPKMIAVLQKFLPDKIVTGKSDDFFEEQKEEHVKEDFQGKQSIDYDEALQLFGGNKMLLDMSIKQLVDSVGSQLPELEEAIKNKDAEKVRKEGHKIRGGAASVMATKLKEAAEKLEKCGETGSLEGIEELIEEFKRELEAVKKILLS